ncbi:DUF1904 family protein [Cohnella sp. AR92]|uniref:DUF1904 family protein n=1 Tax=Cohnella sp. AR92 TaxID=648716 RepID=UPI000F8D1E10|nr:DUF1904 family protein [Cohnella sp. AR92]RUS45227.1 DUF1904 family protein [Cohnella sp. AR92]
MPHLLIRGIGPERVRAVSRELVAELAAICECPNDYIMLECLMTTAVFDGGIVPSYPFVEVSWFDRGLEAQDRFAEAIDRHLRVQGDLPELEVAFRSYERRNYYANGKSFGEPEPELESRPNSGLASAAAATDQAGTSSAPDREEEMAKLRAANQKLADELGKARKTLRSSALESMSTKLRDALRE